MGRPKGSPNRNRFKVYIPIKETIIALRVNEEQKVLIQKMADKRYDTLSSYILKCVQAYSRTAYLISPEEWEELEILYQPT